MITGPFSMVVAIVLISSLSGLVYRWMSLRQSGGMDSEMEEDFYHMQDEIDRLNFRVKELEQR